MWKKFALLEWKNFIRAKSFATNLAIKILIIFLIVYLIVAFALFGLAGYHLAQEELHREPVHLLASLLIYFLLADLVTRFMIQQLPTQNVKPFLAMNIERKKVVGYTLFKTLISVFTWGTVFFFLPFSIMAAIDGHSVVGLIVLNLALFAFILTNNFINVKTHGKDLWVYVLLGLLILLGASDYFSIFSVRGFSERIFMSFYEMKWTLIFPVLLAVGTGIMAFRAISTTFYLDEGLSVKGEVGRTQDIAFLNKFGAIGTFINNDIRLLRRSKIGKSILYGAIFFLFYGLIFFSADAYKTSGMLMFLGLFTTGGFMFTFGQRIPSLDSSYFPLMLTLNVPYREYLNAKWWLMNAATLVAMVLTTAYLFFGWELYLSMLAGGIYNIGVNSHLVLVGGAYNKRPVDLSAKTKAFANKNNFNVKALLLAIPEIGVPMLVFGLLTFLFSAWVGLAGICILGIIGFLLKDRILDYVIKLYKKEKYSTLIAFKQEV